MVREPRIPGLRRLFRIPLWADGIEREVDAEIRFHLERRIADLMASGATAADARRTAEREFGEIEAARTELAAVDRRALRRRRRAVWRDALYEDLTYAVRALRRAPAFTVAVVVTTALGVGANALMYRVADRLLLSAPGYIERPEAVARIYFERVSRSGRSSISELANFPLFTALREDARSFADLAAYSPAPVPIGDGEDAWQGDGMLVTANYFALLGVRPLRGRFFSPADDVPNAADLGVVLSAETWRGRFGGDPEIMGRTMAIGGRQLPVIGIAPPGMTALALSRVDVWVPIGAAALVGKSTDWPTNAGSLWLRMIARVRAGSDQALLGRVATTSFRRWLESHAPRTAAARSAAGAVRLASAAGARGADMRWTAEARVSGWLAALAFVVLLVACANVACLALVHALRRRREFAVRRALGMGRARLLGQLLVESAVLSLLGATVAFVVTQWWSASLLALVAPRAEWSSGGVDRALAAAVGGATLLVLLATALAPALVVRASGLTAELRSAGHGTSMRQSRVQRLLIAAQIAFGVVLLTAAGLFLESVRRARAVDLGFDPRHVLLAQVKFPAYRTASGAVRAYYEQALARVREIPGVVAAGLGEADPFGTSVGVSVRLPGRDGVPELPSGGPYASAITPDYFRALGTRVLRGRGFTAEDRLGAPPVVTVNETLAKLYWPGEEPIGQCIYVEDATSCARVVGVVASARQNSIREAPRADFFTPLAQRSDGLVATTLFVRSEGEATRSIPVVRQVLQALRPDLPYASIVTLQSRVDVQLHAWRLGAVVMTAFGLLALVLAVVGLYAVVAYATAQRTQEIGVRLALGASRADVLRLVGWDALRIAAGGITGGACVAFGLGGFARDLLFQTDPHDPRLVIAAVVVLAVSAAAASFVPAWRASRTDPTVALRGE